MENYLTKAIKKLHPNAEFSYSNNDYSTIKWDVLDGDAPTQSEIDAAIKEIKAEDKAEAKNREQAKQALLEKLGLTVDDLKLLLG
jgi:hypothetical protein